MRSSTRLPAPLTSRRWLRSAACALVVFASAHAAAFAASPIPDDSRQLLVVTSARWDATTGVMRSFERRDADATWRPVNAAVEVSLGRSGSAWGLGLHPEPTDGPRKQEGDGRSPAGVFAIGTSFGYDARADTGLPYQPMDASDYCIDVPASPFYNQIVDARDVGAEAVKGSTEPMRLDVHANGDVRYRQGFVIQHNPANVPRGGSCIFAHLWRRAGETTAGCTAMDDADMHRVLAWLTQASRPVFVLLPESEYHRLQASWQLPAFEERAR